MPPARDPETGKFQTGQFQASEDFDAQEPVIEPDKPAADATKETPPAKEEKPAKEKKSRDMAGINQLVNSFLGTEAPEEETKEKTDPDPTTKPDPDPAKAKEPEKKVAPKAKPAPAAAAPALTASEIAAAAAEGVERAHANREKTAPKIEPKSEPDIPEAQKRRVAVLKQMEKTNPTQYKGLSDKYLASCRKLDQYAEKWQQEHPGEAFDFDSHEHAEFLKATDVEWEDEDYTEAVADLKVDARVEKIQAETNSRLSKVERAEKFRASAPQIEAEQNRAAMAFWEKQGDDYKDLVDANGVVNQVKLKELSEKDPTYKARIESAIALDEEVKTLYALINGYQDFNPKDPIHEELAKFASEAEARMLAQPKEQQLNAAGLPFTPSATYNSMTEEQRKGFWTFSPTDLGAIRAANRAKYLQATIDVEEENHKKWAAARGYKVEEKPAEPGQKKTEEEPDPDIDGEGKPVSPESGGQTKVASQAAKGAKAETDGLTAFGKQFLGVP